LENIAATDFNFGVTIFKSSSYTRKDFCATPTFSLGGGSAQVNHVHASLWRFTIQYRRLFV